MALTPKQIRNGITAASARGANTEIAGPTSPGDIDRIIGSAENLANAHADTAQKAWEGGTAGTTGYSAADWDDGIATTNEV